ncbi:hypothetical protein HPP92_021483 [Vanilla planifolia]|uniref:Uncharacterized protein n=1 Tax=Vanilla planifolia TaxID=51239 RepID=A0A835Q4X8_VANPL|nr:hypothetical protein HPP92_021483 [Vanilla planifolia]
MSHPELNTHHSICYGCSPKVIQVQIALVSSEWLVFQVMNPDLPEFNCEVVDIAVNEILLVQSFQVPVLRQYPAGSSFIALSCLFGLIQFLTMALLMETNLERCKFHSRGKAMETEIEQKTRGTEKASCAKANWI